MVRDCGRWGWSGRGRMRVGDSQIVDTRSELQIQVFECAVGDASAHAESGQCRGVERTCVFRRIARVIEVQRVTTSIASK